MTSISQLEKGLVIFIVFSLLALLSAACQKTVTGRVIFEEPESKYRKGAEIPEPPDKGGPPPWAPAHGYRAKYKYRYYPSSSVYYDSVRNAYFFQDKGSWRASTDLPNWVKIDKGDYIMLEMNTDRPYEFHTEVQEKYPPGKQKN